MNKPTECVCSAGSIRYTRNSELATAPIAYRCANHGPSERATARKRDAAVATLWRSIARPLPLALPAPEALA